MPTTYRQKLVKEQELKILMPNIRPNDEKFHQASVKYHLTQKNTFEISPLEIILFILFCCVKSWETQRKIRYIGYSVKLMSSAARKDRPVSQL